MKRIVSYLLVLALTLVLLPADVSSAATSASVSKSITVVIGKPKQIEVKGQDITSLKFSSTKKAIAKVSSSGKVTGVKTGSVIIKIRVNCCDQEQVLKTVVTVVKKSGFVASKVYKKMMAKKKKYPEGKSWTNANNYIWRGFPGVYYDMHGCAGFAAILSDAAFGKKTVAKQINHPSAARIRVGDMLRMNGDTHSVVVLKVLEDGFIIAEGNYNYSIHWGRKISKKEKVDYLYTRYEG